MLFCNENIAWLAGLIEGEAWIGTHTSSRGRKQLRVEIAMTDRDVLERAQEIAGGSLTERKSPSLTKPNKKPMYRLSWYTAQAERLLLAIRPYMGERRRQRIDDVLEQRALVGA